MKIAPKKITHNVRADRTYAMQYTVRTSGDHTDGRVFDGCCAIAFLRLKGFVWNISRRNLLYAMIIISGEFKTL